MLKFWPQKKSHGPGQAAAGGTTVNPQETTEHVHAGSTSTSDEAQTTSSAAIKMPGLPAGGGMPGGIHKQSQDEVPVSAPRASPRRGSLVPQEGRAASKKSAAAPPIPPPPRESTSPAPFALRIPQRVRERIKRNRSRGRGLCCSSCGGPLGVCIACARALGTVRLLVLPPLRLLWASSLVLLLVILLGLSGLCALLLAAQLLWLVPLATAVTLLLPRDRRKRPPRLDLERKHVAIVGGSTALSRAIGIECVKRGADVTLLSPPVQELEAALNVLRSELETNDKGQHVRYSALDAGEGAMGCFMTLQGVLEEAGHVHALVCVPSELLAAFDEAAAEMDEEAGKGGAGNGAEGGGAGAGREGKLPAGSEAADLRNAEAGMLACVWAARACSFMMQRHGSGCMLLCAPTGSGAAGMSRSARAAYTARLRRLAYDLSVELLPFSVSLSLALPPARRLAASPSTWPWRAAAAATAAARAAVSSVAGSRPAHDAASSGGLSGGLSGGFKPPSADDVQTVIEAERAIDGMCSAEPCIVGHAGSDLFGHGAPDAVGSTLVRPLIGVFTAPARQLVGLIESLWHESLWRLFPPTARPSRAGYVDLDRQADLAA